MKRIGILGGLTAESTTLFYNSLTRLYIEQHGDNGYPEIVIFSVRFQHFFNAFKQGDWEYCAQYLASGINQLEKAGADFAVISANMPHVLFDDIVKRVSLPLIHIADTVAEAAQAKGYKKVSLLGTMATMNASFYPDRLSKYQIECIVPDEPQKEMVHQVLENELFKGVIKEESKTAYLKLIHELKERGAEAVILGCTEIPMLINSENSPLPLLDSSLILAQTALDKALN
ncbi:aspartate racemase [Laceyella sediminis]|jgi:aspartate racemase|uniref:Aspartate racemase n=1 Tax=Laceyella sediminis TaxID=573074 RepID=A0ABX5EQP3_9BACL|nr:amino acid racemase [Laceyella sediminis]PRZ14274.1 aspartate racemase [Laceyella sediminis]